MSYNNYLEIKTLEKLPHLPLEGRFDLTYRCNNNCRHCWVRIPADSEESVSELSFEEIKTIADDARKMGYQRWSISGGEPMLRLDFAEIFDYLTANFASYSINTNGTLITPKIAKLLRRKGVKMVALYGATADVHDHITRNPGSFEMTLRGFRYLKEAGAGFIVQLIPMKDNYYQFGDMVKLAKSLSRDYRVGATWLYLSACGDKEKNREIISQRLPPDEIIKLDGPDLSADECLKNRPLSACHNRGCDSYLFSSCITARRDFHIDPYGKAAFCCFLKDPSFRYDLKKGGVQELWEEFIPSLAYKIKAAKEYKKNCGSCDLKGDCCWCAAYAYLEHGRFGAKIEYLCDVAAKNRDYKENWRKRHRRYFRIADIDVRIDSDLPITDNTFHPKFKTFETTGKGVSEEGAIFIRHRFSLPDLGGKDLGIESYRKPPWAIYKKGGSWIYLGISPTRGAESLHRVAVFNSNHTRAEIYNNKKDAFIKGNLHSLTMFASDQMLLARILADRQGCYLHSCGVNFRNKGLLFVGHSKAGKSTMATMLKGKAEILCDDRIIIRKKPRTENREPKTEFRVYGTWSHGDVPDVSANSAPLKAIMFLEKAKENSLIPLKDKKEISRRILSCLIKPFVTADWWDKTLDLVDKITATIPCYILKFDKSGAAVELLKRL